MTNRVKVFVPADTTARSVGADGVAAAIAAEAQARGLEIALVRNGSRGLYWLEPLVEVEVGGKRLAYGPVTKADVPALFDAKFLEGGAHALALGPTEEIPYLKKQTRLTFARVGIVDPLSLDDYLAHGGYRGLTNALGMQGADIVETVTESGLRGRGGAAFPTGIKWKTVLTAPAEQKYVVCNADEGDSGTFADRMIMESDPFVLIEGMTIAGLAVGATRGFIYVRAEYPLAIRTLRAAIETARTNGYLGTDVRGSGRAFELEVREAAGAYICGEETSLLESLEGKRGMVRYRPPLPAIKGLFGKPTIVNNVISLASVPVILDKGASFYKDFGVGRSRGTLTIQLAGNVKHGGLIELAFGPTLREILYDFGGGSATGRPIRAVQAGGPLGAYVHPSQFDTPLDYEQFAGIGAMIGHGGFVVFDDTVDMGEQARFAMEFCAIESCGKCTPCRIGAVRGVEVIDRIRRGENESGNLKLLRELCDTMVAGSLCALGGMAPFPVLSVLNHYPEDLESASSEGHGVRRERRVTMSTVFKPYRRATDLGTPPSAAAEPVTLTIDGNEVTVPAGTTVLRAAAMANINIPKLCATDNLEPFGSCRLCLVEIEGMRGTPASCTTEVRAGMKVTTQNGKLAQLRRNVMELYISDHPLDCLTCPTNGDCELQDMAGAVGLREVRYGYAGENHLDAAKDTSNPYFTFDPSKCIVCSRCVRACEEVQGTFALTIDGRGFDSKVAASEDKPFLDSECVSCGACVQACPTATLTENTLIEHGTPEHYVVTTCAYCGVGCSFRAEMKGQQVVRMMPNKDGHANHGHSCVKGRFAFGYATHKDRITKPMIRETIHEPWREVSWDEAFEFTANKVRAIQAKYGRDSVGGITSSRCTNEETYLVQKLVRAAFGNNNVDTCARVCHSPTGYGLKTTLGESAGTQAFDSVMKSDVVLLIGANPTDAHPVFASQMKRRLREGAKLIVVDPRAIDLVRSPHVAASYHLSLRPGTNVAIVNAMAHTIVSEGLEDKAFIEARCEPDAYKVWREFILDPKNSPEHVAEETGVDPEAVRGAARLYASVPNAAIYYGLGVTEHSQGSTTVMAIANLAMCTGNIGREGVGVNPLRGQNNVQGSCDMGSFPHELPGYRHVSDPAVRELFSKDWGVEVRPEPGYRIPNMFDAAVAGTFKALYVQGEDVAQSDPDTNHVTAALSSLECMIVQDIFLNETAKFAHVFLPGSSFLEKDGTFTNAERRISPVRKVMEPLAGLADWEVTQRLSNALGYPMNYTHPSEIMDEIARLTPTFHGVSYEKLEKLGSIQWPCNEKAETGTPTMHVDEFVRGKGLFRATPYVPTDERTTPMYPLLLTTGRILSQYNVGAQTRRTDNVKWHDEDVLEIHPHDAEQRGIEQGDWVGLKSRAGETVLRALITERVQPGVVYTTFHHPSSGANVVTTDNSDWATNCPEYKVTAVQAYKVTKLSEWQRQFAAFSDEQIEYLRRRERSTEIVG